MPLDALEPKKLNFSNKIIAVFLLLAVLVPLILFVEYDFKSSFLSDALRKKNKGVKDWVILAMPFMFLFMALSMIMKNKNGKGAILLTNDYILINSRLMAPWRKISWADIERIDTFHYKGNHAPFTGVFLVDRSAAQSELSLISRFILKVHFLYSKWSTGATVLPINFNFVAGDKDSLVREVEAYWGRKVGDVIDQKAYVKTAIKSGLTGKAPNI